MGIMGYNKRILNVSVVTYHTGIEMLGKLIQSLTASPFIGSIYVIDNSSSDELSSVCGLDKRIKYHHTGKNLGYGKGHNLAMEHSIQEGVRYHLVINPDVELEKNTLESCIQYMDQTPEAGLILPEVRFPGGKIQYLAKLLPTPYDLILRRFIPFASIKKKRTNRYELRHLDHTKPIDAPSLSGCFMFLRTDVLKTTGLFDPQFFMYLEDVDLSRRIHTVARTIFFPGARIVHHYGAGSYKKRKLLYYHIKSAIQYFNKWGWFLDTERVRINKKCSLQQG